MFGIQNNDKLKKKNTLVQPILYRTKMLKGITIFYRYKYEKNINHPS